MNFRAKLTLGVRLAYIWLVTRTSVYHWQNTENHREVLVTDPNWRLCYGLKYWLWHQDWLLLPQPDQLENCRSYLKLMDDTIIKTIVEIIGHQRLLLDVGHNNRVSNFGSLTWPLTAVQYFFSTFFLHCDYPGQQYAKHWVTQTWSRWCCPFGMWYSFQYHYWITCNFPTDFPVVLRLRFDNPSGGRLSLAIPMDVHQSFVYTGAISAHGGGNTRAEQSVLPIIPLALNWLILTPDELSPTISAGECSKLVPLTNCMSSTIWIWYVV